MKIKDKINNSYGECLNSCECGSECNSEECFTAGWIACMKAIEEKYTDIIHLSDKAGYGAAIIKLPHKVF